MTIQREDGFLVDHDLQGRLSLGIESRQLDACVAEVTRREAVGVFGSPAHGFEQRDLDVLARLPDLESVAFWDVELDDIDGLYALGGLRRSRISGNRPPLDFSRLPGLEQLVWHHDHRDTGLAALSALRLLHLWHVNPRSRSFDGLEIPSGVSELQINWANPATLEGLPLLPELTRLEVAGCRNLESIAELPRIAPRLEHLVVTACGRVADGPEVVKRLPRLRHAFVRDELLVSARGHAEQD